MSIDIRIVEDDGRSGSGVTGKLLSQTDATVSSEALVERGRVLVIR